MTTQPDPGRPAEPTEYETKARAVLDARRWAEATEAALADAKARWEAEQRPLIEALRERRATLATREAEWRALADAEARTRGVKSLEYGVVVRESARVVTDNVAKALDFAREHAPHCLALDAKAWTKETTHLLDTRPALLAGIAHVETTRTVALPNTARLAEALGTASEEAAS